MWPSDAIADTGRDPRRDLRHHTPRSPAPTLTRYPVPARYADADRGGAWGYSRTTSVSSNRRLASGSALKPTSAWTNSWCVAGEAAWPAAGLEERSENLATIAHDREQTD